jgi:MFS family permease
VTTVVDHPQRAVGTGRLQQRTLGVLAGSQMMGGFGTVTGISVGVLVAATLAGTAVSGLAQSVVVVGQGLMALPITWLMARHGRRPGLAAGYVLGSVGAFVTVLAAGLRSAPLLFVGLFLFGGAGAANYQARYAATDLARPSQRARHLSLVFWAVTLGAVIGPNLVAATDATARSIGFAPYAGPFLASGIAFAIAGAVVFALLRPDPLLTARALGSGPELSAPPTRALFREAMREIATTPRARIAVVAVVAGHATMIAIMAMTPVYIGQLGHAHDATLRILGFTIGMHVLGMFAFAPVFGWLADRQGFGDARRSVILGGLVLLLAACVVAGTAGHSTAQLAIALGLLGLGWSATLVAGSTMLTEAVAPANRPAVQGVADLFMNLASAAAGALAGVVTAWLHFPALTVVVALALVPVVALGIRPAVRAAGG